MRAIDNLDLSLYHFIKVDLEGKERDVSTDVIFSLLLPSNDPRLGIILPRFF